ncbi:hypothetical protein Dimus_035826 [Dionaea muscipula]
MRSEISSVVELGGSARRWSSANLPGEEEDDQLGSNELSVKKILSLEEELGESARSQRPGSDKFGLARRCPCSMVATLIEDEDGVGRRRESLSDAVGSVREGGGAIDDGGSIWPAPETKRLLGGSGEEREASLISHE